MHASSFALFLGACFCAPAHAQLQVSVSTLNDAGYSLLAANNSKLTKTLPANTTFKTYQTVYSYVRTPATYLSTTITPPYVTSYVAWNRFALSNTFWTTKKSGHKSLHTTGSKTGAFGAQKARITITTKSAKNVILDCLSYGTIYDNASITYKIKGPGVSGTWTFNKAGSFNQPQKYKILVNGTVNIDVEATARVLPGTGTNTKDGFQSFFRVYPIEDRTGSFTVFGKSCGNSVISGKGQVVPGQAYTVQVDKTPAKAPVALLFGKSKDLFHFIRLPLPLDYMGAKNCLLQVGFIFPVNRIADSLGHAEVKVPTSRFNPGKYYVQWLVLDQKANKAGFTLTRAGEVQY